MMMKSRHHISGFSLLELLLSVAVFTGIMMAVFNLLQTYAERELARSTDKYLTTIAQAMDQILDNVDNFNALYEAAEDTGGGYQLIADSSAPAADNIAKTFVLNGTTIQGSRLLNNQFRQTSPLRSQVRILLRIADDQSITTDPAALDVLIVTATPRPDPIVRRAAANSSYSGGVIRTYASKNDAEIQSSFGSWRLRPVNGLQATPWFTSELRSSLNSEVDGSYLVYYTYANIENKAGDYLYRVEDPDPSLRRNTMYGAFNIGGNDIIGIDDINIGNGGSAVPFVTGEADVPEECENNVMCVNGTGILKGSGTVSGTMTTNGSALIADSLSTQTMRVQNGLNAAQKETFGAQNLFVVDGNGNDGGGSQDTVHVTGNATLRDGMTVLNGNLTTTTGTTVTMPEGGVHETRTSINNRRISASNIDASRLNVDHQLRSGIIEGGDVVVGGRTGVLDINESRDLQYGSAGAGARTIAAPKVNVQSLSVVDFGTCTTGCGQ